jgi:hypothetical protein
MILLALVFAAAVTTQPTVKPTGNTAGLTADQIKAAQTIVTDTCNLCHADKKPLTVKLLKEETPSKKTGHFRKKAELNDEQIKLMVQYLTAVRDGKAELPKSVGATPSKTNKPKSHGKHERHEDDDDDDQDEHEGKPHDR